MAGGRGRPGCPLRWRGLRPRQGRAAPRGRGSRRTGPSARLSLVAAVTGWCRAGEQGHGRARTRGRGHADRHHGTANPHARAPAPLRACRAGALLARPSDVSAALGDPTRRWIVERLSDEAPQTATQLAADLPISRQAVAKHLGSLADAGLVDAVREGRETRYGLQSEPLES